MSRRIEISHRTIIFTVLFLIFLWFLYFIRDIILIFFVSLLIMAIVNPTVTKLSRLRIPRLVSVLVVYIFSFLLIGVAVAAIIPPLVEQSSNFANSLPKYLGNIGIDTVFSDQVIKETLSILGTLPGKLVKIGFSIFSNILGVLSVLIMAFYLLMARDKLVDQLAVFFGEEKKKKIGRLIDDLELKLGGWARGELFLMLIIGLMHFIGLTLLRIPFALPLSILAGILEIVPTLGPVLAAVPAAVIGFGISPVIGFSVLALAFLVQQLENYIFVPKIMEKSVGVSPIAVLLSLAIGFKVAGVIGILISVPIFIILRFLAKEYLLSK